MSTRQTHFHNDFLQEETQIHEDYIYICMIHMIQRMKNIQNSKIHCIVHKIVTFSTIQFNKSKIASNKEIHINASF